jgi:hypothetical protein
MTELYAAEHRKTHWSLLELLLVAGAFLLLYLPFLSIDYDANGLIEAMNLETGARLSPNHILYGLVGRAIYSVAQSFGYGGKAIVVLQVLNAVCGAIAVALACAAFTALGASRRAALAAAALWGTSFIYWYFSTDVNYVTLAIMFTAGAFWCAASLVKMPSAGRTALMAVLISLSILTFQMLVFLVPIMVWPLRKRWREALLFLLIVGVLVGGGYVVVGVSQGNSSPADLLRWTAGYAGGKLPEWGRFDLNRVGIAASAFVRSYQWDIFEKFKDIVRQPFRPFVWRLGAGAVVFVALVMVTILLSIQQLLDEPSRFFWMIGSYLLFVPFIVWFSPSESYWFLIPNMFLCAAAAFSWSSAIRRPAAFAFIFGSIAIMATSTFVSWVWTKHIDAGVVGRKAECIAGKLGPNDAVIAPDWTWPARLEYFYGRPSIQIIDLATSFRDREKLLKYLDDEVSKAKLRQGRIFIVDPASYPAQHLAWLQEQTQFSAGDFERYRGPIRFQCEDSKFREVTE